MDFVAILFLLAPVLVLYASPLNPVPGSGEAWWTFAMTGGLSLVVSLLFWWLIPWFLRRGTNELNPLAFRFSKGVTWLRWLFQVVLLGTFVVQVHVLRLREAFQALLWPADWFLISDALLILPFLVPFVLWHARLGQMLARGTGSLFSFRVFLGLRIRFLAVGLAPQLVYLNLYRWMATGPNLWTRYTDRFPSLHYAMSGVLLFLLFALSPLFVRLLFPRIPLQQYQPDCPLIAPLVQMANRAEVTLGRLDVWCTGAMRMANAAVTGIWGGNRRVFITDSLLKELPVPELLAVLAHEMGHVHFRHLLINFLLAISTGMVSIWFIWLVADVVSSELILTLGIFGLQIGYILIVFSFFLRRFEHQADLYAAHILGRPDWLCNALLRLAQINGTPMTKSSLTHPSIHDRIHRIRRDVDQNGLDLSRPLRRFRFTNVAVVCAVLVFMASTVLFVELAA